MQNASSVDGVMVSIAVFQAVVPGVKDQDWLRFEALKKVWTAMISAFFGSYLTFLI